MQWRIAGIMLTNASLASCYLRYQETFGALIFVEQEEVEAISNWHTHLLERGGAISLPVQGGRVCDG